MGRRTGKPDALTAELAELAKGKGEEKEKPKISLGDGAALKRALDDAAAAAVEGYSEDYTLGNVKIGVGLFTCSLAALAHFYPGKYPDNFWVLVLCVVLYITATVAVNLVLSNIEGDTFYISQPKGGQVFYLGSRLPRYSEQYTLILGSKRSKWSRESSRSTVKFETPVTRFFDSDGNLLEDAFRETVLEQVKQFEKEHKKKK